MSVSEEQFREIMASLAEAVVASTAATAALTGSQTNFLRAAGSADANIAISLGTPMLYSEQVATLNRDFSLSSPDNKFSTTY